MATFSKKILGIVIFILIFVPGQINGQNPVGGAFESSQSENDVNQAEVDLVWEAVQSYTPPFYKGKSLHSGWGPIRITAIPHVYQSDGSGINASSLIYTWSYNGLTYGDDSGRGRDNFTVNTVPRTGNQVTVKVETVGGELISRESIIIPIHDPEVVLYRSHPLNGLITSEAILDKYTLNNTEEITLQAIPYFFLTQNTTLDTLSYNWEMNKNPINPSERKDAITLRRQGGVSGETDISVTVEDSSRIFPDISSTIDIEF